MKKVLDLVKKWMNLKHPRPWEKDPPNWEENAPSEYEPHDEND